MGSTGSTANGRKEAHVKIENATVKTGVVTPDNGGPTAGASEMRSDSKISTSSMALVLASLARMKGRGCTKVWRRSVSNSVPVGLIAAGDMFLAIAIVPKFSILLLAETGIYKPLWLIFGSAQASVLSSDVGHGMLLAACWVVSAAFAGLFDEKVTGSIESPQGTAFWWRLFITFFVNAWLLLFAISFIGLFQPFSQADVLRMGIDKDVFGPSGLNVDIKVVRQIIDLNIDIAVEGLFLGSWRMYCSKVDPVATWKAWWQWIFGIEGHES